MFTYNILLLLHSMEQDSHEEAGDFLSIKAQHYVHSYITLSSSLQTVPPSLHGTKYGLLLV